MTSRTWGPDRGGIPLSPANLNALEADVTAALGVPDAALAGRINDTTTQTYGALSAAFVPATSDTDLSFRALRDTLDAGRSTAIHWSGDSTGDSDGSTTDLRTPTKLAKNLAAAYPNYHVRSIHWNDTKAEFDPAVILQAATGQRYASLSGRSVRYQAQTPANIFTTGNIDLRVKANMATPATEQVLTARTQAAGTTYGTQFQYRFYFPSTGTPNLAVSYDGATWDNFAASAAVAAGLFNADTWFRATCEIVPGASGSITVKFYTSSDDGATWAQVGTTATYGGTRQAMFAGSTADFEVGGRDWQPATGGLNGKVYEVQIRDGVGGPLVAPANVERWERYGDASTTYGGSPTLWLVNASKSGQNLAYLNDSVRMPKLTPDYGQVIAFFNTSHNEVSISGQKLWIGPYKTWVNNVLARLPLASPVAVIQNPHTSAWVNETTYGESHKLRLDELRAAASSNRWGTLDLYKAFTTSTAGLGTLIQSDGLHPTQAGYDLAAKVAARLAGVLA